MNGEGGLQKSTEILEARPVKVYVEFESSRQTHDVLRVDLGLERSQFW